MAYDYRKIRGRIIEKYGTLKDFAAEMNWSDRTLSLKMNCKVFWKQPEIMKAVKLLEIPSEDSRSVWADFIRDTLEGETLDSSAEKLGFSHQTAFNMRHKVLMALQDMLEKEQVTLSGIAELDSRCRSGL